MTRCSLCCFQTLVWYILNCCGQLLACFQDLLSCLRDELSTCPVLRHIYHWSKHVERLLTLGLMRISTIETCAYAKCRTAAWLAALCTASPGPVLKPLAYSYGSSDRMSLRNNNTGARLIESRSFPICGNDMCLGVYTVCKA